MWAVFIYPEVRLMEKVKIWLSWSTGKDCAYALHQLRLNEKYEINGLLTTVRPISRSVAMHGTPEHLLKRQALELGLPLHCAEAGVNECQQSFEQQMRVLLKIASDQNVTHIAFGDLFLDNIRSYREEKMKKTGIDLLFPLWKKPTNELAKCIINSGFKAVITSINLKVLPISFLGRSYDEEFLTDLPPSIDPCGENGEFHTFVFDGPVFQHPIAVDLGKITVEDDHSFVQLNSM